MQTKNATGVIKTGSTAMPALAVGAFALGRAAVALNLMIKSKPKPRRASGKRAG